MDLNKNPEEKPLCQLGCGFYGNIATEGLCSVCFTATQAERPILNINEVPIGNITPRRVKPPPRIPRSVPLINFTTPRRNSGEIKTSSETINTFDTLAPPLKKRRDDTEPPSASNFAAVEVAASSSADTTKKLKRNRCATCRKKLSLTSIQCSCGGVFCGLHRYADEHSCTFDYRQMGAEEIARNNPKVVAKKIDKL